MRRQAGKGFIMNDKYILKKDHLIPFLRRLKKDYRLVAPVKKHDNDTLFSEIDNLDEVDIDLDNQPITSIKPFLFPQQEILFTYRIDPTQGYAFTEPETVDPPTVFFGVRSCDVSAILYMDVVFLKETKDPFYLNKRKNGVIIALGCNDPFANCFCNTTKNGPFLEFGFDLQFTDLGNRFFVETGRAKGEEIVQKWQPFFSPAEDDDIKAQYQAFLEARGKFKRSVHVDQAIKRLASEPVPSAIWEELSHRCQDCSGCAYICPTCTCFTIADTPMTDTHGERVRSWDACTFDGFTRMAGGHNPVNTKTQSIRKRFLHKLLYDVTSHGRSSCVGCGRCVNMCFGGVDIIRFINLLCNDLSRQPA
ncbi:4Fe-4S dicluster domain-containing protein [Thermodesulfobacteriota bacterium]